MSAFGHLTQTEAIGGYAEAKGVPLARATVVGSGLVILIGGLMGLLGVRADLGALLLVIFLVPTAIMMHGPWKESDPQDKQMEQVQFLKDLGLAGAALMLFAFFGPARPGADDHEPAVRRPVVLTVAPARQAAFEG